MNYPNPDKRFWASMTKSVIRVTGYCLIFVNIDMAAAVLITSELVGIVEELV